jgi:hypothetical protein
MLRFRGFGASCATSEPMLNSADAISVLTDPKGSGEVSEPGDGTWKVGPRACDPQCAEIKLAASAQPGRLSFCNSSLIPIERLVADTRTRFCPQPEHRFVGKRPPSVRGWPCSP